MIVRFLAAAVWVLIAQVAQAQGIQVSDATYGGNCGVPGGNVTADLAQSCNGRANCAYTIDYRKIGDPAVGCAKDYVAHYQCPDGSQRRVAVAPEAGLGTRVVLDCPVLRYSGIHVLQATYGVNCGAPVGNVTGHIAAQCNGRAVCDYRVDHTLIGDPVYGCEKDYRVSYSCPDGTTQNTMARKEAGFGSKVRLDCSARLAAGSGQINVIEASYGKNCNVASGYATSDVATQCQGRKLCEYTVDYRRIGDPAVGCAKDFEIVYSCFAGDANRQVRAAAEAGFGSKLTLDCR